MKRNTQLPRNKVSEKSRSEITGLGCTSCVLPPCVTLASSSVFPSLITYLPGKKRTTATRLFSTPDKPAHEPMSNMRERSK